MENIATIDFETRSPVPLPDTGAYVYAEHPETTILCKAYNLTGDNLDTDLWTPLPAFKQFHKPLTPLLDHVASGGLVEAHNSYFEWCVWNKVGVRDYGWPELKLSQLRCSASKARYNGLPGSLGLAGAAMNLEIQKDKRGKQLINLLCKPRKPTKNNPDIWNNDPNLFLELFDYCIDDVDTEMELSQKLTELPPEELAIWLLDQRMNHFGVYIDITTVDNILQMMESVVENLRTELTTITDGAATTATQVKRITDWCAERGVPLAGLTKGDVSNTLAKNIPDDVRRVLEIRQVIGKTSTAKYRTMKNRLCSDGRVRETVIYHKAHTARWGGSGIQTQNFPRPTFKADPEHLVEVLNRADLDEIELEFGNPFDAASTALRNVLTAAPGNTLIAADYNAIEARVLLWLADDQESLDVFRRGDCLYCEMASSIFPKYSAKRIYGDYKAGDFDADIMRKFGKDTELGCGYQMGGPKFYDTLKDKGYDVSLKRAKEIVNIYREKHHKVVTLWDELNSAAVSAIQIGDHTIPAANKRIQFKYNSRKKILQCKLPSGRVLTYHGCKLEETETSWGEMKLTITYLKHGYGGWLKTHTYGGKLTENVVQAIARDIMRDAMLRLDKVGFDIILTIHDELVAEILRVGDPEVIEQYNRFCTIMAVVPAWAEGLPLKVEGWWGPRYQK